MMEPVIGGPPEGLRVRRPGGEYALKERREMATRTGPIQHPYASDYYFPVRKRSNINWQNEADPESNSAVMNTLRWISRGMAQAKLVVTEPFEEEQRKPVKSHPALDLMRRPNEFYSGRLMMRGLILDLKLNGEFFIIKERDAMFGIARLWWAPSWTMEPRRFEDGRGYLSHYEYRVGAEDRVFLPQDVIHVREELDPRNTLRGRSAIKSVLLEVFTDEEASLYAAQVLRNLGVPGVVISPKTADGYIADTAQTSKDFDTTFGGDDRGLSLVYDSPVDVQVVALSPDKMALDKMRKIPETRISGAFGVPAVVVGFEAGLERSTFANFAEAREAAYESCVIPTQDLIAEELTLQLIEEDFPVGDREFDYDISGVRVLQEDEDKRHTRHLAALNGGGITRAEYRKQMSWEIEEADEVYYVPVGVQAVGRDEPPLNPLEAFGSPLAPGTDEPPGGNDPPKGDEE